MENRKRIAVLMGPPALFLLFLFVLPLAVMAIFTFRAGAFGAEREVFTLANYRNVLFSSTAAAGVGQSFINTLTVAIPATIIPILAVPVSIVGTFVGMHLLGFSVNVAASAVPPCSSRARALRPVRMGRNPVTVASADSSW